MLQVDCDRRYADVMERALYNGVISGISLDGRSFFYENPLASLGGHHRQAWFDCACCPPNVARLLASLGEYIYAVGPNELAVHLYVGGQATFEWRGQHIELQQQTRYPWDGNILLRLSLERPDAFATRLRLPGWCRSVELAVNGQPIDYAAIMDQGYIRLERTWQDGDEITLNLAMPVERIYAHPNVRQNTGRVALQRGPLVYCLEQVDHTFPLNWLRLPREGEIEARFEPDLLGGLTVLSGPAHLVEEQDWQDRLYRPEPPRLKPVSFTAVPYYAWDHRSPGAMQVWLPEL